MNKRGQHTVLTSQSQASNSPSEWHRYVYEDIQSRISSPDFPCIFSKNAFNKQLLKFVFVDTVDTTGIKHLGQGLTEYVDISRAWDGRLDTSYPLIAAFSPEATRGAQSVEDYHEFGWFVLQELHAIDPAPWPEDVERDPHSSSWSMCFNSMPLFCNMSNPGHVARRSRNLGRHFTLVINPRERFDVFAGDTKSGRNVRSNIRSRIERYDELPHSWQLGSYGNGALEWQQYGLIEDNIERSDQCPFKSRHA